MKAASISEIKQQLKMQPSTSLIEICLRLARYKLENKELLTYLLFEADQPEQYIQSVKKEIDDGFAAINTTNLYYVKKSLRKILRLILKHIRYTGSKIAEVELLLHFCNALKQSKIPYHNSTALTNLYQSQLKKIKTTISILHEDLQYDYIRSMELLQQEREDKNFLRKLLN